MRLRFFWLIFLICIISCKQKQNAKEFNTIEKKTFFSFLNLNRLNPASYKAIYVIPSVGCGGCITDAQQDYYKNYKDTTKLYIFTSIVDLKLFKTTLPKDSKAYKSILIDTNSFLTENGFKSIYPSVLNIDNTNIISFKVFKN